MQCKFFFHYSIVLPCRWGWILDALLSCLPNMLYCADNKGNSLKFSVLTQVFWVKPETHFYLTLSSHFWLQYFPLLFAMYYIWQVIERWFKAYGKYLHRLYGNTMPFEIKDLSFCICWYLQGVLEPIPCGHQGLTVCVSVCVSAGKFMVLMHCVHFIVIMHYDLFDCAYACCILLLKREKSMSNNCSMSRMIMETC